MVVCSREHMICGSEKAVFGQWKPEKAQSICLCGGNSYQILHSVVTMKQLGSISQSWATGQWLHWPVETTVDFFTVKNVCVHICVQLHMHGYYIVWGLSLIQGISQCWIRDHLLCGADRRWTTVSYVNWPFVQYTNKTNTFMRCIIQVLIWVYTTPVVILHTRHKQLKNLNVVPHPLSRNTSAENRL